MSETILKDKDLQDRWVAALRSGEYKQGKHALKDAEGGFCCLGLLCEIQREDLRGTWENYPAGSPRMAFHFGHKYFPGKMLKVPNGPSQDVARHLAALNDRGHSFESIADAIEGGTEALVRLTYDE